MRESKTRKKLRWAVSQPCLAGLAVGVALGQGRGLALFLLAAVIHEGGHLLALKLLGGRIVQVGFRLSGAEIRYAGASLSYGGEAALALAGPGVNLLAGLACALAALRLSSPTLYRLAGCQLALGLFNLIPALPLDGGRVLAAALESRFPLRGERWASRFSGLAGLALAGLGAGTLLRGGNLTLLAAGGVILLDFFRKNPLHRRENRVQ